MVKITAKDALNIPNILCYIRILLIPFFMYFLLTANAQDRSKYYIAAFLIFLSGVTDMFDGLIARKFNMITDLGKAIDPIADKLTQLSIALALSLRFKGIFVLVGIVFIKELVMGIFCLLLMRQNKKLDGALWIGKASTWVYYVTMFFIIVLPQTPEYEGLVYILVAVASTFMLLSFILYLSTFIKLHKKETLHS